MIEPLADVYLGGREKVIIRAPELVRKRFARRSSNHIATVRALADLDYSSVFRP